MPISTSVSKRDMAALEKALAEVVKNVPKEINIAAGKAAKAGKSKVAKQLAGKEGVLNIPQKLMRNLLDTKKLSIGASLKLKKSKRIRLNELKGTRQKKGGVSYRIERGGELKTLEGAFQIPKWGNKVYKRKLGEPRKVGRSLNAVSPYGYFKKNSLTPELKLFLTKRFRKELLERLRYRKLKKSGAI